MHYNTILNYAKEMRQSPTKAEAFFWKQLRNRQFIGLKFYRQFIIEHAEINNRKSFFIADFYCHQSKAIFEIDGDIHNDQVEYDQIREDILSSMGYRVLRFTNTQVLSNWDLIEPQILNHIRI